MTKFSVQLIMWQFFNVTYNFARLFLLRWQVLRVKPWSTEVDKREINVEKKLRKERKQTVLLFRLVEN